ncbi:MAG: NAD-dependent isocitrate dehydrogenase [Candidatus Yanofskybacteria bacterium]|nr:NAD-dependent isocitrate dehydrogenase [Candidatus Yanofskybacteria bacterium]
MRTITAIMGDGIGPEVVEATIRVVDATGVPIDWQRVYAGMTAFNKTGNPLPQETLDSIARNRVALKGPCDTPIAGGFPSVNVALRQKFDLFANVRPIKSMPGVKSRYANVDLVIFREGIEGLYGGTEEYVVKDGLIIGAEAKAITTVANCNRFFQQVFDFSSRQGRRVTIVHKANIQKKTSGLFLKLGKELAGGRNIVVNEIIVDNAAQKLVLDPTRFELLACNNEHGDILSDLCAGLVGGLGVVPGANIGDKYAIFEAAHGTAPDIAGKGIANPTALILSAAMMLEHIGEPFAAKIVREAVETVIGEGRRVTADINWKAMLLQKAATTEEMTDEIIYAIGNLSKGA